MCNHEKYLLDKMPTEYPNEEQMGLEEIKHHRWEHNLLSAESIDFLRKLPYRVNLECEGYNLSVMHYCMDYDGHYINYKSHPSDDDLKGMFDGVKSDIILYGHDHCRNICKGDKFYINVGSLGCPAKDINIARAGIVKIEKGNVLALVIGLPFIIPLFVAFIAVGHTYDLEYWTMLAVFAIFIVLTVVHELIHGITWAHFAENGWKSISFGIIMEYLTPYCSCNQPMKKH